MRLLIVRHAPAGDRAKYAKTGRSDDSRPLSSKGREKMRKAAKGLGRLVEAVELVASSPLLRARQTAQVLIAEMGKTPAVEIGELSPEAHPSELVKWLKGRREKTIVLVGHEPHLGRLIGHLCTGRSEAFTELKKGQACLLEYEKGYAKFLWSLTPSQLRDLG